MASEVLSGLAGAKRLRSSYLQIFEVKRRRSLGQRVTEAQKSCAESFKSRKNSPERAPKNRSGSSGGLLEGEKRSRELEEASEELPSHDPRSLSTDYELPRSPRETPKSTPEEPRRPPRDPEERPKEAQESPKTFPRPPSARRRRCFKNRAAA